MQSEKCAIKVHLYDKSEYVLFEKQKVGDWAYFLRTSLIAFGLDPDGMGNANLLGENNEPITEEIFPVIVLQYLNCSHFLIKIAIKSDANEPFIVQDLKYFLLDNGCRSIFLEASRVDENGNESPICDESIQFIVSKLMDFINLKYSIHKWDEVEEVCKAAVAIFPSIDLDRLFDKKRKRGYIYHRVCYLRFKKPLLRGKKKVVDPAEHTEAAESDDDDGTIDELQFLLYFKTCLVDRDLDILKIKLKQSIHMREKLMDKKGTEFHKSFPFFFIQPSLFLYDFEIRKISPVPNALFERWPQMKHDILAAVDPSLRDKTLDMFNDDIGYFLALLKLLIPSKADFENVAGKLITFSDRMNDDPKNSMDKSNEYPNLVAMGTNKADIRCFYIMFDQQQILVPTNFDFVAVMDLFFKLHHVFNLHYHPNLKNFMIFIEHFIYGIDASPVGANTSKLARKIIKD